MKFHTSSNTNKQNLFILCTAPAYTQYNIKNSFLLVASLDRVLLFWWLFLKEEFVLLR